MRTVSSAVGVFFVFFFSFLHLHSFFTRRPLGPEQCCFSLHGILCPPHLLNNSMERGDVSSGIITVWGWQAPLSRARWDPALPYWSSQETRQRRFCQWQRLRLTRDDETAGNAGGVPPKPKNNFFFFFNVISNCVFVFLFLMICE